MPDREIFIGHIRLITDKAVMDKKDNNSDHISNPLNWKDLGFFSADDYLIYIFKKTEKITAGLYLVSGLLKDEEPIKWELRDKGIDFLSSSFSASSAMPGDKNSIIQSLFTAALETLSLLNVAKISNLISDMNHKLLVSEIDHVVGMLRDRLAQNAENAGYILSENFFKTPDLFSSGFKVGERNRGDIVIGQSFNLSNKNKVNSSSSASIEKGQGDNSVKRNERQEIILATLKTQSNLSIKDFSKVIKDCSEKTIQRELIDLVNKGMVKKAGERRWSRYSLNN